MKFQLSGDPEPAFTFLGIVLDGGVTATQAATDALDNVFISALQPVICSEWQLGGGWVTWGNDGGDIRIDSGVTPLNGGDTDASAPSNVCVLTRKITAAGGRRNRGRFFTPGISRLDVPATGFLQVSVMNTWQARFTLLFNNIAASTPATGVALLHDTAPQTPTTITDFVTQRQVATQRRRLRP